MPTVKIGETTGVGMVGTLAFLMSVGGLFFWLGNSIPVVNRRPFQVLCKR